MIYLSRGVSISYSSHDLTSNPTFIKLPEILLVHRGICRESVNHKIFRWRPGEISLSSFLGTQPPAEHICFQADKNVRRFAFNPKKVCWWHFSACRFNHLSLHSKWWMAEPCLVNHIFVKCGHPALISEMICPNPRSENSEFTQTESWIVKS